MRLKKITKIGPLPRATSELFSPRILSTEVLSKRLINVKNDLRNEITRCIELNITKENKSQLVLSLPNKYNKDNESDDSENDDDFIDVNDKEGCQNFW